VRKHQIPSIGSLTDDKPKNELEIDEYLEQITQDATREDLELNTHNMKKYIGGPVKVNTMLLMLYNKLHIGSKTIYSDVMEARVCFQKDTVKQFGDIITQYQAWHRYVTRSRKWRLLSWTFPKLHKHSVVSC